MDEIVESFLRALVSGQQSCALDLLTGNPDLALCSIQDRADPGRHYRPLHVAVTTGQEQVVDALLVAGADANEVEATHKRFTPLHFAAQHRRLRIAASLILRGARPNLADTDGRTALHWCAISDCADIAHLLLQSGADPRALDGAGRTAAEVAVAFGHASVQEVLTPQN